MYILKRIYTRSLNISDKAHYLFTEEYRIESRIRFLPTILQLLSKADEGETIVRIQIYTAEILLILRLRAGQTYCS